MLILTNSSTSMKPSPCEFGFISMQDFLLRLKESCAIQIASVATLICQNVEQTEVSPTTLTVINVCLVKSNHAAETNSPWQQFPADKTLQTNGELKAETAETQT